MPGHPFVKVNDAVHLISVDGHRECFTKSNVLEDCFKAFIPNVQV
ncbi:uncharacterized protein METZ01_LOCUS477770, partial [marine metagenome]